MQRTLLPWIWALALCSTLATANDGQREGTTAGTGLIAGRVVDVDGRGVDGVVVVIRASRLAGSSPSTRASDGPSGGPQPVPVRTDAEGRFVFTGLPAGAFALEASKAGWLDGAAGRRRPGSEGRPVTLSDGQFKNDITIVLWRPAVIAGTVTDDNGDPLVNVEMRAIRMLPIAGRRQPWIPNRPSEVPRQKTDDRGAFRFPNLPPGDYVVAALSTVLSEPAGFAAAIRADGSVPRAFYQTMTGMGAAPFLFSRATGVAPGGRSLVSSLSSLSGVPLAGGGWQAYPTTYHPVALTQSDASVLHLEAGGVRSGVDVHMRLQTAWQVSGVVRDAEGPAAWHAVHLVAADTAETPIIDVATAVTDTDGAFTFHGVPPGRYVARVIRVPWPEDSNLQIAQTGGSGAIPSMAIVGVPRTWPKIPMTEAPIFHASRAVTVGDRPVTGLELALGEGPRIRGRAILEGSGPSPTSAQWADTLVQPLPASGREDGAFLWPGAIAETGQFATPSLWPGQYLLAITPPDGWHLQSAMYQGRDISVAPVDVLSDIDNVTITFVRDQTRVQGTVDGDTETPPAEAVVLLFPTDPAAWLNYGRSTRRVRQARVTASGMFSIDGPASGDYFVVAIPDADAEDWQDPARLKQLAGVATRVRVQEAGTPDLALRVRRIR